MPSLGARGVANLLREYAQHTALRGGNPYRSKAYSRAADSLAVVAVPLDVLIAGDRLTEIPGVGDAIADIITKLHKTGTHPSLEKPRKEIRAGALEMLAVPGLRPEKVLRLYQDLGIASLAELGVAAKVALAPGGARIRLHDEHQSGRALHSRTRPHALGRRDGSQGWRPCRPGPERDDASRDHALPAPKRRSLARAA
jgi:DNA polymerase/3'-5' exonuclease PolX